MVIAIGNRDRFFRRSLKDLGLRVSDGLDRLEELTVHFRHIGPHPKVWLRNLDQAFDLTGRTHAKLDHRDLRSGAQLEQGERDTDVVVEIAVTPEHAVTGSEGLRRQLFGRGLADASGNGHDPRP
jgi:hypothetical protein